MKITIESSGRIIEAPAGANLLELLRSAGLAPEAPCGGNGKCGKCAVQVDREKFLSCTYTVEKDITVALPDKTKTQILTSGASAEVTLDPVQEGYLIAFDIGTTTVVCFLLSPNGKELAAESMLNPQAPFGADVITRIQNAIRGNMEAQTEAIRSGMTELIKKCCRTAGISPEEVGVVSVVGNPCMQQLFMGIYPENLAAIPFAPVITDAGVVSSADYLPVCPNAKLLVVPDISGYVGADTMACVLATRMYEAQDTVLMVDIGTNGEMVLTSGGRMVACSTAAGPALEGANIRFGMRGAAGAVDHVWSENNEIRYSVIGGGEAAGICGSGLIDAVAVMLKTGKMNKRGRIQSPEEIDGQRYFPLSDRVYLAQEDIRQVQMAKGAISAGIHLMAAHLGITVEQIDRVILAGAFGSFMDPESACRIGLLPPELQGRITAAGNIAGSGSRMLAMDQSQLILSRELIGRIEFLELASVPGFQRTFAQKMAF